MAVWKLKPSGRVETAVEPILTAQTDEPSYGWPAPIAEGVTPTLPAAANPWQVDQEQSPEAKALEDAIRSGDRYRVASALASIGVKTDDELLSHILLPPFGEEPAKP